MGLVSPATYRRFAKLAMALGFAAMFYEIATSVVFGWDNILLATVSVVVFWLGAAATAGFDYGQASVTGTGGSATGRQNPCGNVHSLPCGIDEDCPIPAKYHEAGKPDMEIVREAREDRVNQ